MKIILIAFLLIVALVVVAAVTNSMQADHLEKAYREHPELRSAPVVNVQQSTRPLTDAERCAIIHTRLKDKRIADLTVLESEGLQACRMMGY